ncbi:MAG: CoA transferase [Chloroflexi bacterium]|nr:CoA transferase [Chloroflexota bacterium]
MGLPLEGIKVVDMAQVYFGPGAAMYLADQGAEVIKVETLEGDGTRHRGTSAKLAASGLSHAFLALNRNKRSISLDARREEGREVVHRLARWADAFIINLRPGTAKRVGLDYDTLAGLNPRLVYASVSGFGEDGPEAHLPGYDIVAQSRSGVLSTRRLPDGTPIPSVVMINDMSGCMDMAYAVVVALWQREKTGLGQKVECSLLNQGVAMQMQALVWVEGDDTPLSGSKPSAVAFCYLCADGLWINFVASENHQFRAACRVLGLEHLAEDERFGSYAGRTRNADALFSVLGDAFAKAPRDHWLPRLQEAGVPCAAVVEREDVPRDAQVVANEMFVQQDHPVAGRVTMANAPFKLSASRKEPRVRLPAPLLGQHTDEVLRGLGYTPQQVASLRQAGVVR